MEDSATQGLRIEPQELSGYLIQREPLEAPLFRKSLEELMKKFPIVAVEVQNSKQWTNPFGNLSAGLETGLKKWKLRIEQRSLGRPPPVPDVIFRRWGLGRKTQDSHFGFGSLDLQIFLGRIRPANLEEDPSLLLVDLESE